MLKQRVMTAMLLAPLVLAIVLFMPASVAMVVLLLLFAYASWEWASLVGLQDQRTKLMYVLLLIIATPLLLQLAVATILFSTVLFWFVISFLVLRYPHCSLWWSNSIAMKGLMGLLTLVPSMLVLIMLIVLEQQSYLLMLLLYVWAADIGAYFFGRRWGTTKFIPAVSPKKSVQGLFGGWLFVLVIAISFAYLNHYVGHQLFASLVVATVTFMASVVGDLQISMLKRAAGIKDTGRILPGHGGLLDRIDSLTAAAPMFVISYFLVMGH